MASPLLTELQALAKSLKPWEGLALPQGATEILNRLETTLKPTAVPVECVPCKQKLTVQFELPKIMAFLSGTDKLKYRCPRCQTVYELQLTSRPAPGN